jgi:hypothetical protein
MLKPAILPIEGETMQAKHATRDEWLAGAISALRQEFVEIGFPLPDTIRASIGFPSKGARPSRHQRIGECWGSEGAIPQVYISPVLADPVKILDVTVHELVHAAVGCECGHKGPFRKAALAIGLEGKMTETVAGEALASRLAKLADSLGPLPHEALDLSGRKKQSTRMLKAECSGCAYIVRLTRKMIDLHGCPICPGCEEPMQEA